MEPRGIGKRGVAVREARPAERSSPEDSERELKRDSGALPDPTGASPAADGSISEEWIRVAAYFVAERRGFAPGHEIDDWLAAEVVVRAACGAGTAAAAA